MRGLPGRWTCPMFHYRSIYMNACLLKCVEPCIKNSEFYCMYILAHFKKKNNSNKIEAAED